MVYYTETDLLTPEDRSSPPKTDNGAFQDDSSSELQTTSRPSNAVEMRNAWNNASQSHPSQHTQFAPVLKHGHARDFYVKTDSDGGLTDMYGTPIIVNPPHDAPLPVVRQIRRVPRRPKERHQQQGSNRLPPPSLHSTAATSAQTHLPPAQPNTSAQNPVRVFPSRIPSRIEPMAPPPRPHPVLKIKLGPSNKSPATNGAVKKPVQPSSSRKSKSRSTKGQVGTIDSLMGKKSLMVKLKVKS